jgi:hypothetical protein
MVNPVIVLQGGLGQCGQNDNCAEDSQEKPQSGNSSLGWWGAEKELGLNERVRDNGTRLELMRRGKEKEEVM